MSGKTLEERITLLQEKYSEKDYPKMITALADNERKIEDLKFGLITYLFLLLILGGFIALGMTHHA